MAQYTEIIIDQGTKYTGAIPVTGSNGLTVDLTGYMARGQARKSHFSSVAVDFDCDIDDPLTGMVYVSLTPAQTSSMKPGRHVWDVEIYNVDESSVIRIAEGQIEITPRVTRPDEY